MEQRQFPYWKWAGLRWLVLGAGVLQLVSLAMQINDWIDLAGAGIFSPRNGSGIAPGRRCTAAAPACWRRCFRAAL